MLKFLDKVILKLIAWLYLKHTVIFLKLEARRIKKGGLDTSPPTHKEIEAALAEFGLSVEQLGSTSGLHRARNTSAELRI